MPGVALCPECGKAMTWDRAVGLWDCGPPDEGGHGFWDPLDGLELVDPEDD